MNPILRFKKPGNELVQVKPATETTKKVDIHFTSLISQEMESQGNIFLRGNLRIDGYHEGDIKVVEGFKEKPVVVHVSKSGTVDGLVEADIIIVDGKVKGTVFAKSDLYIRGKVQGSAYYGRDVDVTGNISAQLERVMTEDEKAEEEKISTSENVHHLHTKSNN